MVPVIFCSKRQLRKIRYHYIGPKQHATHTMKGEQGMSTQGMLLEFLFSLSNDKKTLVMTVNGKTFKVDMEDGTLTISLSDIIVSQEKNLFEFDRHINSVLSKDQRFLLYNIFANSTQLGKKELINVLGVDKGTLERVIALGLINGVFRKIGSQMALSSDVRQPVQLILKEKGMEEGKEVVLNPIDEMKEEMKLKEVMDKQDTVIGLSTRTSKTLPKKKVKK